MQRTHPALQSSYSWRGVCRDVGEQILGRPLCLACKSVCGTPACPICATAANLRTAAHTPGVCGRQDPFPCFGCMGGEHDSTRRVQWVLLAGRP